MKDYKIAKTFSALLFIIITFFVMSLNIIIPALASSPYPATPPITPPTITPTPTCQSRPACLDLMPHPCKIPEPIGGWCKSDSSFTK